jgi:prepilin-type N-terminal cleavage/methylation domain-containing protein
MRARPGVTLLELMLAVAILGGGLLALAGPSAALARHLRRAAFDVRAAAVARDLAERLAATCTLAAAGDSTIGTIGVRWTAGDDGGTRRLRLEVVDRADPAGGARAFDSRAACPEESP